MNQDPFEQSSHSPANGKSTFTSKSTKMKVVGWIGIAVFLFCAIASYLAGQGDISPFFLLFVALGVALLLMAGELKMNSQEIAYSNSLQKFQMSWADVHFVEMDKQGGALVFCSRDRNKLLSVIGPYYWAGRDKEKLSKFMAAEMEKRQIKSVQTQRALFRRSKNTRVR